MNFFLLDGTTDQISKRIVVGFYLLKDHSLFLLFILYIYICRI